MSQVFSEFACSVLPRAKMDIFVWGDHIEEMCLVKSIGSGQARWRSFRRNSPRWPNPRFLEKIGSRAFVGKRLSHRDKKFPYLSFFSLGGTPPFYS